MSRNWAVWETRYLSINNQK